MRHSNQSNIHVLAQLAACTALSAALVMGCKSDSGSGSNDGGDDAGGNGGDSPSGEGDEGGGDGEPPLPVNAGGNDTSSDNGSGGENDGVVGGAGSAAGGSSASDDDAGTGEAGGAGSGAEAGDPLYAMMVQVYSADDRTVYFPLSKTADVESVSLDTAREFPGVANFAAIGGRVLVSDGSAPLITEFTIDENLEWNEGRTVSFAEFPLEDNANFYSQFLIDDHTAWLPFEGTSRIIWDPTDMEILRTIEDTMLVSAEPTLTLDAGGNRNSLTYENSVLQAFYYHDEDWYHYGSQSHVVVYDGETLEEVDIIDVPCPGLTLGTRDEDGNTYFGNWGLPTSSLVGDAPAPCVIKVTTEGEITEMFDPRDWTDGRFVDNFRYIRDGKAFGNVLHPEEAGIDLSDLSEADLDTLWETGSHWKLWLFDVESGTGAPVDGIDVEQGSGAQFAVFGERTFMFVPFDEWSKSRVYELDDEGTATARFDTVGDIFKWVQVR